MLQTAAKHGLGRHQMISVEIHQGNICLQFDCDAIVNAANAALIPGGGVAGAIHQAAGPELADACYPLGPIKPGQAVITPAFKLPNRWVIHCLGPRYGLDEPAPQLLSDCYRHALDLAVEHQIQSIAFPAISTGIFSYPLADAARVAIETVCQYSSRDTGNLMVRFVLFDANAFQVFQNVYRDYREQQLHEKS